jgi:hypothetical protein
MEEEEAAWVRVPRELDELRANTGIDRIVVPGGRPVSFAEGRRVAYGFAAQGYYVEGVADEAAQLIRLKIWEFGREEPSWGDIAASARPSLVFGFSMSAAAHSWCEGIVDELVARHHRDEAAAVSLVNRHRGMLPWLSKLDMDPWRDDVPTWWAKQIDGEARLEPPPNAAIGDVDHRIFVDLVHRLQQVNGVDGVDAVLALPRPAQVFYVTKMIDLEVCNGGFHQLFCNAPEFAMLGSDAFRELGSLTAATLTARAVERRTQEQSAAVHQLDGATLEDFAASADESSLHEFDAPFYEIADGLAGLRVLFARSHPEAFTLDAVAPRPLVGRRQRWRRRR